jgi:hypothetical protein
VIFLGHVISTEGISMNPRKVKAILKWKRPTNMIEIHSFIGLARYYQRFIERFSTIAIPMT